MRWEEEDLQGPGSSRESAGAERATGTQASIREEAPKEVIGTWGWEVGKLQEPPEGAHRWVWPASLPGVLAPVSWGN